MEKKRKQQTGTLFAFLIVLVFIILCLTFVITMTVLFMLLRVGILSVDVSTNAGVPLAALIFFGILASLVISLCVSVGIASLPMRDLNSLIRGLHSLADGDFSYRIDVDRVTIGTEVANSFNTLAAELEGTEMLRSDFVNNFSHEIKTPVVSIRGFARLLQKQPLTDQQREYADIIADESSRLADMTQKILDLTKVENTSILTDVETYNLSEQLRRCCLLFMDRAEQKNLEFEADFPEKLVRGNPSLLQQVWVNILDNAVKYAIVGSTICVTLKDGPDGLTVTVRNPSDALTKEEQNRIFQKFYQADTSHSGEGTGIGLSLVKRIVELHDGRVDAFCKDGFFTIRVALP